MATPRYEPWSLLNRLQQEIDQLMEPGMQRGDDTGAVTADWVPAVDILEDADRFVIRADLPGVQREQIDLTLDNGVLTIKGQRPGIAEEERRGYKRAERPRGTFYRRFMLPDTADPENVGATCRDGILEVTIPKQQQAQPRRINVEG